MNQGERHPDTLVFGRDDDHAFTASTADNRAKRAWKAKSLKPITMHEARHHFASIAIAAGVNVKALSTHMGHNTISMTLDLYGYLMPGNEAEATTLLDVYLVRSKWQSGCHTSDLSDPERTCEDGAISVAMPERA